MKKILVLSGKGGTGKTTVTSTLIDLMDIKAFADCDVDAPNLHLIKSPKNTTKITEDFQGMDISYINQDKCIKCGKCLTVCRFDAIKKDNEKYFIDSLSCEGCTVCQIVCPEKAIVSKTNIVGQCEIFKNDIVFSTAKLNMGSGNSGKLVTQVKKNLFKNIDDVTFSIIDGSPGIGCPVIASLSGIDLALIVTEPTLSGLSDLKRIVKTAKIFKTDVAIVLNKCNLSDKIAQQIIDYAKKENLKFFGNIPYDKMVSETINKGNSLSTVDCEATTAIKKIRDEILKELS